GDDDFAGIAQAHAHRPAATRGAAPAARAPTRTRERTCEPARSATAHATHTASGCEAPDPASATSAERPVVAIGQRLLRETNTLHDGDVLGAGRVAEHAADFRFGADEIDRVIRAGPAAHVGGELVLAVFHRAGIEGCEVLAFLLLHRRRGVGIHFVSAGTA